MNCKQGDLAIVVKAPLYGLIFRCIKYVGKPHLSFGWTTVSDCWEIDREVKWTLSMERFLPDSYLRPIRDSDRTDEIIERIGKPVKETT